MVERELLEPIPALRVRKVEGAHEAAPADVRDALRVLPLELLELGEKMAPHLAGALPWWNVAVGNLLASVTMVAYFFRGHRSLGARMLERWTED